MGTQTEVQVMSIPRGRKIQIGWLVAAAVAFSGCNKLNTRFSDAESYDSLAVDTGDELSCLATAADYELETEIVSFEISGGASASAGFSFSGLLSAIGLGVSYSTGTLTVEAHLSEPLARTAALVDASGASTLKKFSFDSSVSVWLAALSFSTYTQTPIATLTKTALQNAMAATVKSLRGSGGVEGEWTTVASRLLEDGGLLVPVGANAGLKVGDRFNVTNVDYEWEDDSAPCSSALLMARRLTSKPIAVATVQQISTGSAYLTVSDLATGAEIKPYAVLTVSSLAAADDGSVRTSSSLARSIRLGSVSQAQSLVFTLSSGAQSVDLTPYVREQLASVVRESSSGGFFIRE